MDANQAILVTGSAGLIGSCLVKHLQDAGETILELDLHLPPSHAGHGDFCNREQLTHKLKQCKGVVHLAGVSRVGCGERNASKCWDINVLAVHNLLDIMYHMPQKPWIIYGSSREVYGQNKCLPVNEDAPLDPINVYAKSKAAAEHLINDYRAQGLVTSVLRFSSVYGSITDYPDRVIPAFCYNAVFNRTLHVNGSSNQFDFTHVEDTVEGLRLVMKKLDHGMNNLPPIQLTTGKGTSLLEVIKLIEHILKRQVAYYETPAINYEVQHFYGDPTRAKKLLQWEAKISLTEGLTQLLSQYQNKYLSLTPT